MSINTSVFSHQNLKANLSRFWADTKHYAKVAAIAVTIGTAIQLGLPSLVIMDGVVTLQLDGYGLLATAIVLVGLRYLSDELRKGE